MALLQVALGGAIGAVLRYLSVSAATRAFGTAFPWGTLLVNVAGSVLMGLLAVVMMERLPGSWRTLAPFVMTGVLGGFTTFSAFSLDAWYLLERGRHGAAALYVGGSVALSVLGLALGLALGRVLP
jgi:CrcB protein